MPTCSTAVGILGRPQNESDGTGNGDGQCWEIDL